MEEEANNSIEDIYRNTSPFNAQLQNFSQNLRNENNKSKIYPWDPSNFNDAETQDLIYTDTGIHQIPPTFCQKKEKLTLAQKFKVLTTEYEIARQPPKVVYEQSIPDIVQIGNQEEYFKTMNVPIESCALSPMEFNDFQQSGFETHALSHEMAIKNKRLLERIGVFSPALSLMLERPAAIVSQSAFIKRLDAIIKYEIQKCECPSPGYTMSWLFDLVRTNSLQSEEPGLVISNEPDEKLMARFKIYQKAFTSLCLHFESLRPILRDIKRTYEAVLCMRNKQIREVLIVKKSIEQYEKLLDAKREEIQRVGYIQLNELQQQCFLLMRHVDKQDAAILTMTEMLLQLEKSLIEEHDLRSDSETQRRLLIGEVNELRRKYGLGPSGGGAAFLAKTQNNPEENIDTYIEEDIITSEDPILLRTTLESTRKTLSEVHHRITILEADYSDVVPMEDYNLVKAEVMKLEKRNEETSETFNTISSQIQGLRNQIEILMSECNKSNEILEDLNLKPTPRPSWTKIGEHFTKIIESEDETNKWADVYNGNSSNVIVQKLVEHITGKKIHDLTLGQLGEISQDEFITPLGMDSSVPRYLRYNYYVINRHFSKNEAIAMTQDIWQSRVEQLDLYKKIKDAQDEEASGNYNYGYGIGGSKKEAEPQLPEELPIIWPFPDYVAHVFKERFHLVHLRMEWTYNVIESCKLHPNDLKLSNFLGTLESKIDEASYHLYRSQLELVRTVLTKRSEELKTPGGLIAEEFYVVLKNNFPLKTDAQIADLLQAAAKQTGNYSKSVPIKFATFFVQTEHGLVGEFVTEVAKQLQDDCKKYVYEVLGELLAELGVSLYAAENAEIDPAGDTDVTMQNVYSAFITVDPTIPPEKVGSAIAWIFLGESTLPGQTSKGLPLVDYITTHMRRKAALSLTTGNDGGGSDEEDDHDDDDFERIVRGMQQRKHSISITENDDDDEIKNSIRRLKVANLRTVMRRLKGSAFLRHGVRSLKTSSTELTEPSTKQENTTDAAQVKATTTKAAVVVGNARKSIVAAPEATSSEKKKSVPVVDLFKRN